MQTLVAKHSLYGSLGEMLTPSVLSKLLGQPTARVTCRPMEGHSGLSGSQLLYVDTGARSLVLKRMAQTTDWIMFASEDHCCRAVTLWQYGLLDRLRPHIEHKIVACARDGDGWAILMDDLTGQIYSRTAPMAPGLLPTFLDAMARLHATYWNDPRLADPQLGLCSVAQLFAAVALTPAQERDDGMRGVIPRWVRRGWELLAKHLDPDVYGHLRALSDRPEPLFTALERYPRTLLHGDFRAENLGHAANPVMLDWQQACRSLMTIDLAWFAKLVYVRDTIGEAAAIRIYRTRLESYLGQTFADECWQAMVELGYLCDALRIAWISAYFLCASDEHEFMARDLTLRHDQVRAGLRWL